MRLVSAIVTIILLSSFYAQSQIETTVYDSLSYYGDGKVGFFTNRPLLMREDGSFTFKNSFTDKTNTLYFCHYDFATDSIELNYKAINHSNKYPTDPIQSNFLYQVYKKQRLELGIKNFYIVVGGYGKSFKLQVNSYMKRLKEKYGDELFDEATILVFAWGVEEDAYQYYNAVRRSKNGANDFAIFQHMLDEFISDTTFWETHPNDLTIDILFSSMGNNMFKEYIERREKQHIPLVKTYNRIIFVGSVAPRNSLEEGKVFYSLNQMADSVDVFINSKDFLLKASSLAHLNNRLGNSGPLNPELVPDYMNIIRIDHIIKLKDMSGLGHDYILTNPVLQEEMLDNIHQNVLYKKEVSR